MTLWRLGVVAASKSAVAAYTHVYVPGGSTSGGDKTAIEKFAFSNDAHTTSSGSLPFARRQHGCLSTRSAGYVLGGVVSSTVQSAILKIATPSDTVTTISDALNTPKSDIGGGQASGSSFGYLFGGQTPSPTNTISTVAKFTFSTETDANLGTGLSFTRTTQGFASSTHGYCYGGNFSPFGSGDVAADGNKFAFADDSRSTLATGLSSSRGFNSGFASSSSGYAAGGTTTNQPTGSVVTVDKFAFSNDSRSTLATGLSAGTYYNAGGASDTAGYHFGGRNTSGVQVSTVNKFLFSDDSRTTLGTGLPAGTNQLAAFPNGQN